MKKQRKSIEGDTFKLDYILENTGWAILKIEYNEVFIQYPISYLHNSLKELIDVTNLFLEGKAKLGRIVFVDEPGELHLLLEKITNNTLKLKMHRFDDWVSWNHSAQDHFELLMEINISLKTWSQIVLKNVEKIYTENGIQGYKEKWVNNDFPFSEYSLLKILADKQ